MSRQDASGAYPEGQNTKQVAELLDISVRTVETHRNSIYRKTSCNGLDDLRQLALTLASGAEEFATVAA